MDSKTPIKCTNLQQDQSRKKEKVQINSKSETEGAHPQI